jgi:replication factor C subunit 2/4
MVVPFKALRALIKTSDGDLRRAITYLQSASRLHAASSDAITAVSIQEIGGVVPDQAMRELGRALGVDSSSDGNDDDVEMNGTSGSAGKSGFGIVQRAVEKIVREGYSATQVLIQVSGARGRREFGPHE